MSSLLKTPPEYPSLLQLTELGFTYEECLNYIRLINNEAPNPDLIWRQVRKDAAGGGGCG